MFGQNADRTPQKIGFLLLPEFSMLAFTSAIAPLRSANRLARKELYAWRTLSLDGLPITASTGVTVNPDSPLVDAQDIDVLFVCAGTHSRRHLTRFLRGELRGFALRGTAMGALCTGSVALAFAGILTGYRCTIHWENIAGFREIYPDLDITSAVFEIDRNRYTCSGGTAPLDMMLHCIKLDHGTALSMDVAEFLLHNSIREPDHAQRTGLEHRTGLHHKKLLAAIREMESAIENPVPLIELADRIALSLRQLERLFKSLSA